MNDCIIASAISNDSELKGKLMPVLLSVVKHVVLNTFQILFFLTHLDDVYTLQS